MVRLLHCERCDAFIYLNITNGSLINMIPSLNVSVQLLYLTNSYNEEDEFMINFTLCTCCIHWVCFKMT